MLPSSVHSLLVLLHCRPVALLSVFGGTVFNFNPFSLKSAVVAANDYTLAYNIPDSVATAW